MWKDIKGYEGLYKIHEDGTILAAPKTWYCGHGSGSMRTDGERVVSSHKNQEGYIKVNLRKEGKVKMMSVHRLLAVAFIPNPENLPMVNHIDGVKTNNAIENLEWCTNRDNILHAVRTGLLVQKKGEESKCRTITDEKALEIHNAYLQEPNSASIARRFGLSRYLVQDIVNRRGSYKELPGAAVSEEYHWAHMKSQVVRGEKNPTAKFSDAMCDEIRRKREETSLTLKELAKMYGCSPAYIFQIISRTGRFRKVSDS